MKRDGESAVSAGQADEFAKVMKLVAKHAPREVVQAAIDAKAILRESLVNCVVSAVQDWWKRDIWGEKYTPHLLSVEEALNLIQPEFGRKGGQELQQFITDIGAVFGDGEMPLLFHCLPGVTVQDLVKAAGLELSEDRKYEVGEDLQIDAEMPAGVMAFYPTLADTMGHFPNPTAKSWREATRSPIMSDSRPLGVVQGVAILLAIIRHKPDLFLRMKQALNLGAENFKICRRLPFEEYDVKCVQFRLAVSDERTLCYRNYWTGLGYPPPPEMVWKFFPLGQED